MKVRERMSPAPETIDSKTSIDDALKLMREKKVRHLPVTEDGNLVGMVTDTEVRTAWFPSLLEKLTIEDVMQSQLLTIEADDTIYEAARITHGSKVTGLPVMESGKLVGIITLADILGVFVEVMGLLNETTRLDVVLPRSGEGMDEVSAVISRNDGSVISVSRLTEDDEDEGLFSFRLRQGSDADACLRALKDAGYRVSL